MNYFTELRDNVRPLAAACIGIGTGTQLFAYSASVFVPHLVKEFRWSRAEFALIGLSILAAMITAPFAGRMTDRFGVFPVAVAGVLIFPLFLAIFAFQQGEVWHYFVISLGVQVGGCLTSGLIYTRLIAERFERSTGLALTIANCTPAMIAMFTVPALNLFIEAFGWRSAYLAVALFSLAGGFLALWLIPPQNRETVAERAEQAIAARISGNRDYRNILGSKVFWIIAIALFLCLLQTPLHAAQMNLMLVENDISAQTAANVVAVFAAGTLIGKIACGLALDRFPTPAVAVVSMTLPALGLFLLATDWNAVWILTFSMFLVGLSYGAENDLNPFLVARYFKLPVYNTTLGLVSLATYFSPALGALGISLTLKVFGTYSPSLYIAAAAALVGGLMFAWMPWRQDAEKVG